MIEQQELFNSELNKSMEDLNGRTVEPIVTSIRYVGGKRVLAKTIIKLINEINHKIYAEAFFGMGGVFFRRVRVPQVEIINDLASEVFNLFQIFKYKHEEFLRSMQYALTSRETFNEFSKAAPETLTELERAVRFLYMQRVGFGGATVNKSYQISLERTAQFNAYKISKIVNNIHKRLSTVSLECLPFQDFIARYDRKETLFYLDPPYFGGENMYGKGLFRREDFSILSNVLLNLKGRFILSLNDVPEIRETFKEFNIQDVVTKYSIAKEINKNAKELLISN